MTVAQDSPAIVIAELEAAIMDYARRGVTPPRALTSAILDLHKQLEVLDRHRAAHPLAYARLWSPECEVCPHPDPTAPAPPKGRRGWPMVREPNRGGLHTCPRCGAQRVATSQLGLVQDLLIADYDEAFALGGNRTGKTEAGAQLAVAFAQGADHPDVQAWALGNGLSLARLQRGPTLTWAVSQTFGMSLQIQRPKLDLYLPAGSKRRGWENPQGEAEVRLPQGGKVICKAAAQSGSAENAKNPFEGAAIGFAWVDEEIPSPIGYQSIRARTTDKDGLVFNSMTALSGWTPFLLDRLKHMERGTPRPPRLFVDFLHAVDNPYVSREVVLSKWATAPEAIKRARLRGEIVALEGAVHPDFHNGPPYVVPSFAPPAEWTRYGVIDFGSRAPFCHLWAAHDESADVLHVYREHYAADMLLSDHAAEIWRVEGCPDCMPPEIGGDVWQAWRVRAFRPGGTGCQTCGGSGCTADAVSKRWADPEGKDQRGVLQSQYDLPTAPAPKARPASFDALHERFAIREKWGTPGVVIHDVCTNLIRETSRLTWRKTGRGGDVDRYETDGDDHAHDCLRYLCYALRRAAAPATEDEAPAPRS